MHQAVALLCCLSLSAGQTPGKRCAVLVGVKSYDHRDLADLKHTETDVVDLARLLRGGGYEVTLLCDAEGKKDPRHRPTRKNIHQALQAALAR
jgi:hypothetical protein